MQAIVTMTGGEFERAAAAWGRLWYGLDTGGKIELTLRLASPVAACCTLAPTRRQRAVRPVRSARSPHFMHSHLVTRSTTAGEAPWASLGWRDGEGRAHGKQVAQLRLHAVVRWDGGTGCYAVGARVGVRRRCGPRRRQRPRVCSRQSHVPGADSARFDLAFAPPAAAQPATILTTP